MVVNRNSDGPFRTMGHGEVIDCMIQISVPRAEVPVGGRLQLFAHQWHRITEDPWVLEIVTQGYSLEFIGPPPTNSIRITPTARSQDCPIRKEVQALLAKNAARPVTSADPQTGFFSHFFLRPKKSGGLRPILNLRPLNQYLVQKHFKMDHLANIVPNLSIGLWAISIDLTDAYLHVPVREAHQRFLRFALSVEEIIQFLVLCFGLRTAPRVFTKLVIVIAAYLRRRGFQIFMFLDDWLLVHQDVHVLMAQAKDLVNLVTELGFLINWEKSDLQPSQSFVYLGVQFDLRVGLLYPSKERLHHLQEALSIICKDKGGR